MKMTIKMQVLKPGNEVRGWIGAERVDTEKGSQKMERCETSADITQTPILRITGNVRNIYIQRRRRRRAIPDIYPWLRSRNDRNLVDRDSEQLEEVMTMMIDHSLSAHWCDTCKHLRDDGYSCAECDSIKDNDLWEPKEGGNHDEN